MKRFFVLIFFFFLFQLTSNCQTDSSRQLAKLSVRCNQPNVKVFDDSLFLGIAPTETLSIKPGTHIFCYVSNERSWLHPPTVETVLVRPFERVVRNIELPAISVVSLPVSSQSSAIVLNGQPPNNFPLYASSGGAVVFGIAAAFLKIRSDNYYAEYRLTGDQARLDQVRRLDTASGIALAVSEASLFWLTYTLLSR